MTKLYVTKYSLTSGIEEVESDVLVGASGKKYIKVGFNLLYVGTDCFASYEEAKVDAEARRVKKLKSLQKQIKKLENLTF